MQRLVSGCFARGRTFSATAAGGNGVLEYRQYTLAPGGMKQYLAMVDESAALRKGLNPGWLGMFTAETGGMLSSVHHFYLYRSFAHRASVRHALSQDAGWQRFIDASRPLLTEQRSSVFMFADDVHAAARLAPVSEFKPATGGDAAPPVYELRAYQLILGYNPVPEMRKAFSVGIPAKLSCNAEGQLAFIAYSEVGELNQVIELWRFKDATSCIAHREASRALPEWRAAIGKVAPMVQNFSTSFLQPVPGSPWQ